MEVRWRVALGENERERGSSEREWTEGTREGVGV